MPFISLLSPFDRTRGLVCGRKVGQSLLKTHLDLEAWVLQGETTVMINCALCNEGLVTRSGEVDVRFISLLCPFDCTQGLVCEEEVGQSLLKNYFDLES